MMAEPTVVPTNEGTGPFDTTSNEFVEEKVTPPAPDQPETTDAPLEPATEAVDDATQGESEVLNETPEDGDFTQLANVTQQSEDAAVARDPVLQQRKPLYASSLGKAARDAAKQLGRRGTGVTPQRRDKPPPAPGETVWETDQGRPLFSTDPQDPTMTKFVEDLDIDLENLPAQFNMMALRTEADFENAWHNWGKLALSKVDEQRRGVMRDTLTRQLASEWNILPEIAAKRVGDTLNAEQMLGMRMFVEQSKRRLDGLATKIATGDQARAPEVLLEFQQRMGMHFMVYAKFMGFRAEAGRALRSFQIDFDPTKPMNDKTKRAINEALEAFGGEKDVVRLAKLWQRLGENWGSKNRLVTHHNLLQKSAKVIEHLIVNGLVSGPWTHMRNITSTGAFVMWNLPVKVLAASIGEVKPSSIQRKLVGVAPRREEAMMFTEVVGNLQGIPQGIMDAFIILGQSVTPWKGGLQKADILQKIDTDTRVSPLSAEYWGVSNPWARGLMYALDTTFSLPANTLQTTDEMFKGLVRQMELHGQANAEVGRNLMQGVPPQQAFDRGVNVLLNPSDEIVQNVQDVARYMTFTDEIPGKLNDFLKWVQGFPIIGRIIMPFRRTPLRLFGRFVENSPLAVLHPRVLKAVSKPGRARDEAIARFALGSGLAWGLHDYIADSNNVELINGKEVGPEMRVQFTGRGPSNVSQRNALWRAGWRPWSIVIPKEGGTVSKAVIDGLIASGAANETAKHYYISYFGIEPIGNVLAVIADVNEQIRWAGDEKTVGELIDIGTSALFGSILDRSVMTGLSNLFKAIRYGGRGVDRYLASVGRTLQPYSSLQRQWNRSFDSALRDTSPDPNQRLDLQLFWALANGWREASVFHQMRDGLGYRYNLWGDQMKFENKSWWDVMVPFYKSDADYDPVELEVARIGGPLKRPPVNLAGVTLPPSVMQEYIRMSGKTQHDEFGGSTLKQAIQDRMGDDDYIDPADYVQDETGDEYRAKALRRVYDLYKYQAQRDMFGIIRDRRGRIIEIDPDLGQAKYKELSLKMQKLFEERGEAPPAELPSFLQRLMQKPL
jgi:hypothetical protein